MKATCPTNKEHKTFYTTAHVVEEWKVDENGDFLDRIEFLDVAAYPDRDNCWTCAECGAEATVV